MPDPRAALERELGGPLSPGLDDLSEAHLTALVEAISTARHEQALALERATEQGLAVVPKMLRGAVRKVVFG